MGTLDLSVLREANVLGRMISVDESYGWSGMNSGGEHQREPNEGQWGAFGDSSDVSV